MTTQTSREYHLHIVSLKPHGFITWCHGCDVKLEADAPRWADRLGEPFIAYYCRDCAGAIGACGIDH